MATSNTIAYNKGFGSSPGNPPGRKDAPLSIITKVFNEFDQDDFVSVKFLLNGLSSKFNLDILENSNLLVLEHADLLKKATVFQSFSPNDPNALKLLLKEILFVIKRYDLLQKYFNTCEHIMDGKEKTSTLIDPYWKKLYMVYDNIGDSRYSLFKYHLGFDKDVTDCSTLLIKWYKTCELPPQQKIEHLAYILEKIGEKKVADRILGQQNLEEYYPMDSNPCGTVVIFNQIEFDNSMLEDRNGTNVDRDRLKSVFRNFGFEVESCDDYTSKAVKAKLDEIAKKNHASYNCFICCVLSHGCEGSFFTKDGKISIRELKEKFTSTKVPTLCDKPKLFFIQACQGKDFQKGASIVFDTSLKTDSISRETPDSADMLTSIATVEGYTSMRHNADGSWYIEALTDALNDYGDKKDIKNVLMIVNDIVSKYSGVIVNSSGAIENGNVKQMPKQEYTLRKNLKFKRNKR